MNAEDVKKALQKHAKASDALFLQGFFKTGKGQYGEGDVFIGVRVPQTREVAKQFKELPLYEVQKLMDSEVHEHRLAGVVILTLQYPAADEAKQQAIYDFYLANLYRGRINNWDLIDISADKIIGKHVGDGEPRLLFQLARSEKLWEKRAGIMASFQFIKRGDPGTTLELAEVLLQDRHDLIQKAVGWMLREVGKRCDEALLTDFLDAHAHEMPRTMLRYSIERLSPEQKTHYMGQKSDM